MSTYAAQNVVFGQAAANALLNCLKTAPLAALLATGKLRLSHDPAFNPNPQTALSALSAQEANYSGYPSGGIAVALTVGVNLSPGAQGAVQSALFEAATATPFVSDTVTGWWIDDGTIMWCAEKFTPPFVAPFQAVGDFLQLLAAFPDQLRQPTS